MELKVGRLTVSLPFFLLTAAFVLRDGTRYALLLFGSVFLHELCHLIAINRLGGRVEEISLRAFRIGIRQDESRLLSYGQDAWVAAVGPLGSFLAAGAVLLIQMLRPFPDALFLAAVNLGLGLLNLVPVFPLDGGRLLLSILALRTDYERALRLSYVVSLLFAVPLMAAGVLLWIQTGKNVSLFFLGCYLLGSVIRGH